MYFLISMDTFCYPLACLVHVLYFFVFFSVSMFICLFILFIILCLGVFCLFVCLFVGVSVCLFFIIYVFLHHSPLHLLFGCAFCSSLYIHDIGLSVPFVVGCRCHFCHILEHWGLI